MIPIAIGIAEVKDVRNSSGLRHPLPIFLTMVSLSIMSGYNSLQGIVTFFESNKEEFIELFIPIAIGIKHGVPIPIAIGNTQIRTILKDMDYDSLLEVFQSWIISPTPIEKDDWVAGDGKALASTLADSQSSKQSR